LASSGEALLLDTSAALALIDPGHSHHDAVLAAISGHQIGLSGHAAHELFSVLTRMPFPARLTAADAARVITVNFRGTKYLDARTSSTLTAEFADFDIVGGAVFDGLVAACARAHGLPLVTCDRRAQRTYDALRVTYRMIGI